MAMNKTSANLQAKRAKINKTSKLRAYCFDPLVLEHTRNFKLLFVDNLLSIPKS